MKYLSWRVLAVNVRRALKNRPAVRVVLSRHLDAHLALPYRLLRDIIHFPQQLSDYLIVISVRCHVVKRLLIFHNGRSDNVVNFSFHEDFVRL